MQARFSTPSSLAAHHRRLMASCAESGCPQVRQRSGAKLSARTVCESLCMSKSVEAHYRGQIVSARDLPTGCQQRCSLVVPTVRAARHLTNRAPSHLGSCQRSDRNANLPLMAGHVVMTGACRPGSASAWAAIFSPNASQTTNARRTRSGPRRLCWRVAVAVGLESTEVAPYTLSRSGDRRSDRVVG